MAEPFAFAAEQTVMIVLERARASLIIATNRTGTVAEEEALADGLVALR